MANQHFYEQSATSWMNEWADEGSDLDDMTDEEQEEAETSARIEMEQADREAADCRQWERERMHSPPYPEPIFDGDAPF